MGFDENDDLMMGFTVHMEREKGRVAEPRRELWERGREQGETPGYILISCPPFLLRMPSSLRPMRVSGARLYFVSGSQHHRQRASVKHMRTKKKIRTKRWEWSGKKD